MDLKDLDARRCERVITENDYTVYLYRPSLLRPLWCDFEPMSFVRRCRYLTEYLAAGRYVVYYLARNEHVVGFCVVTPGGRKLKVSSKNDIVLGPYYIDKKERGKGLSKILIRLVLDHYYRPYDTAYDWIMKTNKPSILASKRCGFQPISELNVVGLLRVPKLTVHGGAYILYQYHPANRSETNVTAEARKSGDAPRREST